MPWLRTPQGDVADPAKVHYVDIKGKYYQSRGPLNTIPSKQRRPVVCQAGGSPAGRDFAAKYADTVVAIAPGPGRDEGLSPGHVATGVERRT
jgi:long-chain alkane monooxygenase